MPQGTAKVERNAELIALWQRGANHCELGRAYGIDESRVRRIIANFCKRLGRMVNAPSRRAVLLGEVLAPLNRQIELLTPMVELLDLKAMGMMVQTCLAKAKICGLITHKFKMDDREPVADMKGLAQQLFNDSSDADAEQDGTSAKPRALESRPTPRFNFGKPN